jgi:endonuclease/exonuclease/phosphatase family metal-dependent hydrolase
MKKIIFIIALFLVCASCFYKVPPQREYTTRAFLDVITYNIKIGLIDFNRISNNLQNINPDVILLQEVHGPSKQKGFYDLSSLLASRLSFYHVFGKAQNWLSGEYGLAILSRYPIKEWQVVQLPNLPGEEQEVFLKALLSTPYGEVWAYTVHLVSRGKNNSSKDIKSLRLEQARVLLFDFLKLNRPAILGGDFNTFRDEVTQDFLHNNLMDTFEIVGMGYGATFPNYFPIIKLDYIFANRLTRAHKASVLFLGGSDHLPLWARIEIY